MFESLLEVEQALVQRVYRPGLSSELAFLLDVDLLLFDEEVSLDSFFFVQVFVEVL